MKIQSNTIIVIMLFIVTIVVSYFTAEEKIPTLEYEDHPIESIDITETEITDLSTHSPEDFGANGFDNNPDTTSLQKAIDHSDTLLLKDGARYIIDEPLESSHTITIKSEDSDRPAMIIQRNSESALLINNEEKVSTFVSKKIAYNQPYVVLNDTEGMEPGDLIHLVSSKLWFWDNRGYLKKGEMHRIKKIEGNKVYLDSNTNGKYNVGIDEIVMAKVYPQISLELSNVSFAHPSPLKTVMIKVNYTIDANINNVSVTNSQLLGIQLKNTYNSIVNNVKINLGTTKDITSGYGIQDWGGRGTLITNSTFARVRRGVDFSGDTPSRFGTVTNSKAYGYKDGVLASGNSGFGTHSTADHITFKNNYVKNFSYGFLSRGTNITVENNVHEGYSRSFIAVSLGNHVNIVNNSYKSINKSSLEGFIMLLDSYKGTIEVSGNNIERLNGPLIKGKIENLQDLTVGKNSVTIQEE
ncbi:hypothetical protein P5G62_023225 [Neobacillus sp. 179-C4.2 HS]|uniref:Right handed beta helix domain-containing protein n=1 Tax=Neobacillus driksii TaxID=3035913 RepID=A0ABV4YYV5_9BACI|nr:hypothetical protein [Neobacillus sp. 179.-C4.2 HS]MDP5194607.1 hypothetical protein [Neobacillus sp. 179.-C4.2 HS]